MFQANPRTHMATHWHTSGHSHAHCGHKSNRLLQCPLDLSHIANVLPRHQPLPPQEWLVGGKRLRHARRHLIERRWLVGVGWVNTDGDSWQQLVGAGRSAGSDWRGGSEMTAHGAQRASTSWHAVDGHWRQLDRLLDIKTVP